MKITFLGTGTSQGIPVIGCSCKVCRSVNKKDKRLRSSVLIENQDKKWVIDAGPDFRQQMLREKVNHLDAILLTHEHKDHIAGLDDIRSFNYIQKKAMDIYAEVRVHKAIRQEFAYAFFEDRYPGIPEINLHKIENDTFHIGLTTIVPLRLFHMKLPILGFRIANFTYITDCNHIPDDTKEKIKGSEIIVINALRKEAHISHFNLSQALKLLDEFKPAKAFLTHISHFMGKHTEINKELPDYVEIAYDGMKIKIK